MSGQFRKLQYSDESDDPKMFKDYLICKATNPDDQVYLEAHGSNDVHNIDKSHEKLLSAWTGNKSCNQLQGEPKIADAVNDCESNVNLH